MGSPGRGEEAGVVGWQKWVGRVERGWGVDVGDIKGERRGRICGKKRDASAVRESMSNLRAIAAHLAES